MATTPFPAVCAHQFHTVLQTLFNESHKLHTEPVFVGDLLTAENVLNGVQLFCVAWTNYSERGNRFSTGWSTMCVCVHV